MQFIEVLKKRNTFLWVLFVLVMYHLLTLNLSPFPWFDEVFFADLSLSQLSSGKLISSVTPLYLNNQEFNVYGPLYFYLQSIIISLFGISAFTFRILNLISSVVIIFLVRKQIASNQSIVNNLLLLMLAFSPIYIQNSHSGRMDLFAVVFVFSAFLVLFSDDTLSSKKMLFIVFLLSIAILITPRVMFLTPGLIIFFIPSLKKKTEISTAFLFGSVIYLVPVIVYCLWSYYCSGSFTFLIESLINNPVTRGHAGFYLLRNSVEDLVLLFFCVLYVIVKIKDKKFTDFPTALLFSSVIFQITVKESGPYGAMQLPFEILGIAFLIKGYSNNILKKLCVIITGIFAGLFILILCYKTLSIVVHYEERNAKKVEQLLVKNDVNKSNVLATFPYFYELINKNNRVFNYEIVGREISLLTIDSLKLGYIFILEKDTNNLLIKNILSTKKFKLVDSLKINENDQFSQLKKMTHNRIGYNSFEGFLYKKNDE